MRLFVWRLLVLSSTMAASLAANSETRPLYGGTLRIVMRASPSSLDPGDTAKPDSFGRRSLTALMFDTLVTTDENARPQPSLATSWQTSSGGRRWQFRVRRGVNFHDGAPISGEIVAASLRVANPSWRVSADGDSIVIETASPDAELLAELALPRNAIVKRNADSTLSGTGPFKIADWQPGKKLALAADENCWHGRPFVDAIEVEMGKTFRDQMTALELGKADLVEAAVEQMHRMTQEGRRVTSSTPIELLALVFTRDVASPEEKLLREALALSVERGSIRSVLLQGAGQPAASILPNWMSGYGFVFPTDADLPQARQAREKAHIVPSWTLGYDGSDSLARLVAERIALNAKDAGLSLQTSTAGNADLRFVRIPMASPDAWIALSNVAALMGTTAGKEGSTAEDLYASEVALLSTERIIPLFHLPVSYAASASLNNWRVRADGSWAVADAWLGVNRDR